jgi:hypothetical protein
MGAYNLTWYLAKMSVSIINPIELYSYVERRGKIQEFTTE